MLPIGLRPLVIAVVLLPLAAACSRDATRMSPPGPGPLTPAPAGQVDRDELPPPDENGRPDSETEIAASPLESDTEDQQAAAPPPETAEAPTREDVLGQWSLSGPSDNCQMFVSLTSWEGGYRASTRDCDSPELDSVGAWDIENDLVVLKDNDGNPLGSLARTGPTRYEGRLDLGGNLAMSR